MAEDEFFNRKLLIEAVKSYQDTTDRGEDAKGVSPFYNAYHYHVFSLVIPEHAEVQPHRVMTDTEVGAFLARERLARQDLDVIFEADPPVIWIGGRHDQLIEVTRRSETAGKAIAVRRVVKMPIS